MLIGEYHHNIDEKGRLIIPSKFREEIGNSFVVTKGLDGCLFVYSLVEWEKIVSKLKNIPFIYEQDIDAQDYVYDIDMHKTLSGKKMQKRRNHFNAFMKEYEQRYLPPCHSSFGQGKVLASLFQ